MKIKILLFGVLWDVAGAKEIEWPNADDVNSLLKELYMKYPALKNHRFRLAVNLKLETLNLKLNEGDVVALLPQFSGG